MIRIMNFSEMTADEIFARSEPTADVSDIVSAIIDDVRKNGDDAIIRYAAKFDGIDPENFSLELSEEEKEEALRRLDEEDSGFIEVLRKAAANIEAFHRRQVRSSFIINEKPGIIIGQKIMPMERAGLYVPGGTAAYPSTVLMDSIPALIAGVSEIIMVTPPNADGTLGPAIVAAAAVAQETGQGKNPHF